MVVGRGRAPCEDFCDADGCMPTTPTSPITGITGVDSILWYAAILTGQVKFPLFDNWFKVSLSQLMSGYTFGPDYPGYADPSGPDLSRIRLPGHDRRSGDWRIRDAVGQHDIYAGSVQALPKLLQPFNGRSVNEPNSASRPRGIRQRPCKLSSRRWSLPSIRLHRGAPSARGTAAFCPPLWTTQGS